MKIHPVHSNPLPLTITKEPTETSPESLKLEIKGWEHAFRARHGRAPTKADIKSEPIAVKYKQYRALKQPPAASTPQPPQTPQKTVPIQTRTPVKTSPMTPLPFKELGPTPQLDGRVMGLFEIVNTPSATPAIVNSATPPRRDRPAETEFATPTKRPRRLSFSGAASLRPPRTPQRGSTLFSSPTRTPVRALQGSLTSPSPFGPSRGRKSLSTMFQEVQQLQNQEPTEDEREVMAELARQRDIEAQEAEMERIIAEDQERNQEVPRNYKGGKPWKKRGQKRTTMKVRINVDPRMVKERRDRAQG